MDGDVVSDGALMRRVAAGDEVACRQLVDRHLRGMVGLAYRMLDDRAAAEDVAQECFLRLWQQSRCWRAEARVATWLYRVAHNLCVDQLRRRRRHRADPLAEVAEVADPADGPLEISQRAELAARVDAAIRALPERQRTAITLVHHQEVGNIAAAEIMGTSVEALESLLARGRRTLRERLRDLRGDGAGEPR
jgi:RNA polymerase sigma-70 factor (ECF subfamily)